MRTAAVLSPTTKSSTSTVLRLNVQPLTYTSPKVIDYALVEASVPRQHLEVIASGLNMSIQKYKDKQAVKTLLHSTIEFCADNYTSAVNLSPELLKECTLFVFENFSFLGVEEIKQAFRVAAGGITDVDLNTYHGKFNVNILAKVLTGYKDYRKKLADKIKEKQDMLNQEARKAFWSSEEGKAKLREWFYKRVKHLHNYPDSASAFDYDKFTALGFLEISTEEKKEYMAAVEELMNGQEFQRKIVIEGLDMTDEEFVKNKKIYLAKKMIVQDFVTIIKLGQDLITVFKNDNE